MEGVEGSRQARDGAGEGEEDQAAESRVIAEELHPLLVLPHEDNGPAHGSPRKVPAEDDHHPDDDQRDIIEGGQVAHFYRGEPESESGPCDAEAVVSPRYRLPLRCNSVEQGVEGEGEEGEVGPLEPDEERSHGDRDDGGGADGDEQAAPERKAVDVEDGDGRGKGPDAEEHGMTEREQPGITEKDVVTDPVKGKDDDLRQHIQLISS